MRRQYLLDASFGVLLVGPAEALARLDDVLRDPAWGVWFGRKCCIPAAPMYRAGSCDEGTAWRALIGEAPHDQFHRVEEVERFDDGQDTINDQPVSFGTSESSGPEGSRFAPRRVKVVAKSGVAEHSTST